MENSPADTQDRLIRVESVRRVCSCSASLKQKVAWLRIQFRCTQKLARRLVFTVHKQPYCSGCSEYIPFPDYYNSHGELVCSQCDNSNRSLAFNFDANYHEIRPDIDVDDVYLLIELLGRPL